jgi:murein DD-endopeptidase MepM/ murein hydrolase activator NlpD
LPLLLSFYFSCNSGPIEKDKAENIATGIKLAEDTVDHTFLDISVKGLKVDEGKIGKNELLAHLLAPYNVVPFTLNKLAIDFKSVFDIRTIRAGDEYAVIYNEDSLKLAQYFVYRKSAYKYFVMKFQDSSYVYEYLLPVDTVEKSFAGTIKQSLFQTFADHHVSMELGHKLADIMAWQIDFFKLRKNDHFKVIYDELTVGKTPVEIGRVKAIEFNWGDEIFYAFNFKQDELNQYFDDNGKSLRKTFLKAPLDFTRISSRYTMKRFHPIQKIWKSHLGTDYAAPTGTPIRTVGDGIVIESGHGRGNGNYVKVKHNSIYTTQYLHMSRIAPSARKGKTLKQGQVIGYVGSTGLATGPHLCFRFWKNGKQIDPFTVKVPPTVPVNEKLLPEFNKIKAEMKAKLGKIKV